MTDSSDAQSHWWTRLRAATADLSAIREGLRDAGLTDPTAEDWTRIGVAAELLESAALSLALRPDDESDAAVRSELEEATGAIPESSNVEETETERTFILQPLRERLYDALDEALADLSSLELRALAAHPDATAALVLVAGLGGRMRQPSPLSTLLAGIDDRGEMGGPPSTEREVSET